MPYWYWGPVEAAAAAVRGFEASKDRCRRLVGGKCTLSSALLVCVVEAAAAYWYWGPSKQLLQQRVVLRRRKTVVADLSEVNALYRVHF